MIDPNEVDRLLALRDGFRAGPGEVPDMVRFRVGHWDVDLFVSKSPYDRQCLDRAVQVEIDGIQVRVVSAEDLLVHKMVKIRHDRRRLFQDVADVRAVLQARGEALDWNHLNHWLPSDEAELLRSVATLDDDELLVRLLKR